MENVISESSIPDNKSTPSDSRDDISCPVIADTPKDTTEVAAEELQEEPKVETVKASFEPDTEELRHGYRILKELMVDGNKTVNWPFMEAVDSEAMGLYDYYERVQKPMWLKKMKEKFESSEYETITQFVADFRLMLENCYRYNGPDHWVSKRGQRFETMLEQKLALLSRELREKTSIAATSKGGDGAMPLSCGSSIRRRGKNISPHDSSALLSQLRREEALKEREARKQQILERKAAQEAVAQELIGWENALLEEPIKTQLQHLWELPQIGLFLFLCQEPLNIGEVMQFELERSFAMTRESVTLQSVMTTLLSTPYQRTRLDKKPMMPYSVWEEKLRGKIALWYKILAENDGNAFVAATKLGIDPYLFTVIGKKNPLDKKKFHELSYYRKIWIVKSLCDFCLATQESIREAMEAQPVEENREYVLGYDAGGNTYMHFPQFCGADLRVYRQAPIPHPEMDPIPEPASEPELESEPETPAPKANKRKQNRSRFNTKKKKRKKVKEKPVISPSPTPRPSRLRQHIKPVLPLGQIESSSSESETDDETAVSSMDESSTCSSTFTASSAYFRDRRFRNGSFSSKDNTPEPPSFRGKIRKPRNFDSRLNCYSPVSRLALEDGSLSSKEGTPEPVGSCEKDAGTRIKNTRAKSKMNKNNSSTAGAEDVDNANESGEETDAFKFTPFQNYTDKNSGKSNGVVNSELKEKLSDVGSSKCDKQDEKSGYNKMVENKLEVPMNNVNSVSSESINPETESVSIEIGIVKENCSDVLHNENVNCDRMSESVSSDISASKSEKPEVKTENVKEEPNKYSFDSFTEVSLTEDVKYEKDGLEGCQRDKITNHSDQLHDKVLCEKMDVDCDDTCETKAEMNSDDQEKCLTKAETKDNCSLSLLANMAVADLNDDLSLQEGNVKNQATDDSSDLVIKSEQIPSSDTCFNNSVKTESSATEVTCRSSNKCDETETKCGIKPEIRLGEGGDTEDCSKQGPVMESLNADPVPGIAETPERLRSDSVQPSSEDAQGGDPLKEQPEKEEEDEVVPELGEFSLIADSVESLRNLVEKFAEPEPTPTRSKRGKIVKPPARKKCVVELHGHLMFLLKELEPWEGKLVQASKRARVKLRKEKESFKAEEEKKVVEDVWESEESASEEEESSSDSDADKNSAVKPLIKNGMKNSKAETLGESAGSSVQTAAVDNEETTTSSRGRIRKRRIIPNNTEDVPKKRKVVKNLEENFGSSGHCPNILQRTYVKTDGSGNRNVPTSLMQQLNMPALNTLNVQPNSPATPNQTASQILLRANLSGNQSISSLLASSWAVKTPSGAKVLPAETVQRLLAPKTGTTHPVIQQLLAQKVQSETSASGKQSAVTLQVKAPVQKPVAPQTEDTSKTTVSSPTCSPAQPGLHANAHIVLAGNKSRKIEIAKARPAAIQLSSVTAKGIPSTSKVQLYNQNVLSTLPPAVIQQLLKNQTLKIQTATSDKQGNAPIPGAIILSPSGNEGLRTFSVTGTGANPGQSHPKITGLVNTAIPAVSSVNSCVTSTQPSGSTTFSSNSLVPVFSGSQDSSPAITVPTSPSKPKYACHVTVKSLLQDRAKKALELQSEDSDDNSKDCAIVPSAAQVLNLASEVGQQLPGVLEMSKADSNSQPIVVTVNTAIKGLPQTLKLPSKETLDSAVQAVVTSVKTTLPTAHLKVPAPSTMPSIHPRKNVTRTIQSMKSPIPVINASVNSLRHPASTSSSTFPASSTFAIAQQSNSGGLNVKPSSQVPLTTLTASTLTGNQLTLNPQMDVTVSGKVVGGASVDTSPQMLNKTVSLQANSTTLTMTPQMIMTAQGLIQGYLTPQGLVIPQSAVQQGSFSSKQVVLGQSINSQVQKKAIVSGSQGKVTPTTVSSMPGKVIKPTMLLPTSYVPKGAVLPSGPDPFKNAPVKSTIKSPVNSSEPLATASSSKLLLQAVNTAKSPNNLLQETVAKPVINTGLSGTGPLPGSLMSGMNIRIDSKDSAGVEEILHEHVGQLTNKLVSSENCHVDQKGDGGTQTSQPETTLHTKAPKHSVVEPVREQQPQHFVKKEPVCSKQQPTQLSDNSGLPAAQVLLSLSQGIQTSTSVVSPHKLKSVNEDPQPGKPQLISPSKTKQTPIASSLNQLGSPQKLVLLNIGGKLYTSQGIPVTLENGVLKIAESTSLKTTQPSLKQPGAHSSMLQIPAAVQGNVSVQKSGVHRSVKPVAPANQQSHPTVGYGVTAPQISSVPKPTSGLPQTALVPGLNNTSLPQSLSANMINHGQVMIRPVLPGTPALIQSQPQTMGSQNSVLAVPGQTQHPIQLVGLNSQQQHVIGGKGQVLQMVLPQASPSATQMNSAQLKSLVVAGQPGVIVAAPPRPAQIPAGQQLLSPKRISPKVPVSGVQFVQNVANPASGGQQQVLLQVISPNRAPTGTLSTVMSPGKNTSHPLQVNPVGALQNVVGQQSGPLTVTQLARSDIVSQLVPAHSAALLTQALRGPPPIPVNVTQTKPSQQP